MAKTFALIGNPNSGKTTLFNQITGSNQHVGNFPGVTVEKKEGSMKKHEDMIVVDLPGIYSLSPYSAEEVVTRDFLIKEKPDCVIDILDATNIERNLYLTLQLIELGIPMVVALNLMDEVRASGNSIDVQKLSQDLGIPVIPISASKNEGIDELLQKAIAVAMQKIPPQKMDFCTGEVHRAIHSIAHLIEDHAQNIGVSTRFAATKLVEGDDLMIRELQINENEKDILGHVVDEMEQALQTDREAALADMRYQYIDHICRDAVSRKGETKEHLRSVQIDRILTHQIFSIPIFIGIMALIFWLSFNVIGGFLSDLLAYGIDGLTLLLDDLLSVYGINPWVHALIIEGVCSGVGTVLSFLPLIVVMFFFLSLLEDSGYMARVAFVMDKLLRKFGLTGRSFVPMLIGFGCSVPAIMATRTLASEKDRKMTILLIPFMSCSAKLPIYALFTAAFFESHQALVMVGLYLIGILMGILVGFLFKHSLFKGNPVPFVMELPSYRLPALKSVLIHMWEKAWGFVVRAFTVILGATVILWILQSLDFRLNVVTASADSILATIGAWIAPLFAPLGFGSWEAVTALITGFTAKEAVVSSFAVLTGADAASLGAALSQIFSPLAAFAFLVFTLLYTPCVAAISAVRHELGSIWKAIAVMAFQTGVAWVVAFLIYQIGSWFFL